LVDAVLDARKGKLTTNLNGKKYTYNFFVFLNTLHLFLPKTKK
jgi:hypothetical protein